MSRLARLSASVPTVDFVARGALPAEAQERALDSRPLLLHSWRPRSLLLPLQDRVFPYLVIHSLALSPFARQLLCPMGSRRLNSSRVELDFAVC